MAMKLCECGCGQETNTAPQKLKRRGLEKGEPFRWVVGHSARMRGVKAKNYRKIGTKLAHVCIAEKAIGHPLPPLAKVHHFDGDSRNNKNSNLVICENQAYHFLLHVRTRVLRAGGNPNTQKVCSTCRLAKDYIDFYKSSLRLTAECKMCRRIRVAAKSSTNAY